MRSTIVRRYSTTADSTQAIAIAYMATTLQRFQLFMVSSVSLAGSGGVTLFDLPVDLITGPGELFQPLSNSVDRRIRSRSACGNSNDPGVIKPFRPKIEIALHMMHPCTVAAAGLDQFVRVVAVRAANDDDYIGLAAEFNSR